MIGSAGKAPRSRRTISPTPFECPCAVETATTSTPRSTRLGDVREDAVAIEFAGGGARGGDARAADEAEVRIARRLQLRAALVQDALDIRDGEEPAQVIAAIDHEQLVDADVLREKAVRAARWDRGRARIRRIVWTFSRGVMASAHADAWRSARARRGPGAARAAGFADRPPGKCESRSPSARSAPARRR